MGRALIGCCLVATANQSSPHSGPILSDLYFTSCVGGLSEGTDDVIFGELKSYRSVYGTNDSLFKILKSHTNYIDDVDKDNDNRQIYDQIDSFYVEVITR